MSVPRNPVQWGDVEPRRVVVTGLGLISPLGNSAAALYDALCTGRSAIRSIEGFPTEGLPSAYGGEITFIPREVLPEGNLRPLDRTGQLATAAAQLALAEADLPETLRREKKMGLVLGTMYGSIRTISAFDQRILEAGPKYVKPFDFANSVINAAAGQTAIWHGLTGINSTLTGGPPAGLQAIAYGVDAIRSGRSDMLLAGGAEELSFESCLACAKAGLLAEPRHGGLPQPIPFGAQSDGFILGEGAAFLVLEELTNARARGATILAELRGHASTFDVSRGGDLDVASQAMARTIRLALEDAGCGPEEVVAVGAGASGCPRGDLHEAIGLAAALGRNDIPVSAIKGQLGESMGASAAFQTVVLLEALRIGSLPGIAGLEEVAAECPLEALSPTPHSLPADGPRIGLLTSSGLDGNVSALVLQVDKETP